MTLIRYLVNMMIKKIIRKIQELLKLEINQKQKNLKELSTLELQENHHRGENKLLLNIKRKGQQMCLIEF